MSSMSRQCVNEVTDRTARVSSEEEVAWPFEELVAGIVQGIVSDALWLARDDPANTCWVVRNVTDVRNASIIEQLERALIVGRWRQGFQNRWLESPCVASLCPRQCIAFEDSTVPTPSVGCQCTSCGVRVARTVYPRLHYFTDEALMERCALRAADGSKLYHYTVVGGHEDVAAMDSVEWSSEEIVGSAGLYAPSHCDCDTEATHAIGDEPNVLVVFPPPTHWVSVLRLVESIAAFLGGFDIGRSLAPLTRNTWTWCTHSSESLLTSIMMDRFRLIDSEPLWWTGGCETSVETLRLGVLRHPLVPRHHEQLEARRIKIGLASAIDECSPAVQGTTPTTCLLGVLDRYEELLDNGVDVTKSALVISLGHRCEEHESPPHTCRRSALSWDSVASKRGADVQKLLRLLTKCAFRDDDKTSPLMMEIWWRQAQEDDVAEAMVLDARAPAAGEAGLGLLHYRRWHVTEACRSKFPQLTATLQETSLSTRVEREHRAM